MSTAVRCIGVFLCLLSSMQTCSADDSDVAEHVTGQTVSQLQEVIENASKAGMIPSDIKVRVINDRSLFACTFRNNPENVRWAFVLNCRRGVLLKHEEEYSDQGFTRALERTAKIQGRTYHTVIWHKEPEKERLLTLPVGKLPITGIEDDRFQALDDFFSSFLEEHNAAGVSVALAQKGRLVYSRGFGYADVSSGQPMQPDSQLRIASVSKPITAMGILRLVQQDRLSLDDRVLPILERDGLALRDGGDPRWKEVTVRHLLQHTGGWDRDISGDPMFKVIEVSRYFELKSPARQSDIVRFQLGQPFDFAPGERYAYSNFGYCVLGRVMEIVSGKSYEELMTQLVLAPAGVNRTQLGRTRIEDRAEYEVRYHEQKGKPHSPFWEAFETGRSSATSAAMVTVPAPYGRWDLEVMDAHGAWISTAPDLLRLVDSMDHMNAENLTEASRTEMLNRPEFSADSGNAVWYGLGWQVRAKRPMADLPVLDRYNIWHSGALAGTSTILVRRYDGLSWAILFNTDRSANGKRLSGLVDSQMHGVVRSIDNWPNDDLFDREE